MKKKILFLCLFAFACSPQQESDHTDKAPSPENEIQLQSGFYQAEQSGQCLCIDFQNYETICVYNDVPVEQLQEYKDGILQYLGR